MASPSTTLMGSNIRIWWPSGRMMRHGTRHWKTSFCRRPDGSVGMALVLPALTDCRWWFESLLVHSGVSSATRRKATGADHKKNQANVFFPARKPRCPSTPMAALTISLTSMQEKFARLHVNCVWTVAEGCNWYGWGGICTCSPALRSGWLKHLRTSARSLDEQNLWLPQR